MVQWTNKSTIPAYIFIPRKPIPCGQEYHTIADVDSNIIFGFEIVDKVKKLYDDQYRLKMTALCVRMTESTKLHGSRRIVYCDSAFASLDAMEALRDKGLYSIMMVKKKNYWPKGIAGQELLEELKDQPIGFYTGRLGTINGKYKFVFAGLNAKFA